MERASAAHQTSWRQTTSGGGPEKEEEDEEAEEGDGEEEVETDADADADGERDHSISARPMPWTRSFRRLDAGNSRPQQLRVTTLIRLHCWCCC